MMKDPLLKRVFQTFMMESDGKTMASIKREIYSFSIDVDTQKQRMTLTFLVHCDRVVKEEKFVATTDTELFKRYARKFQINFRAEEWVTVSYREPDSPLGKEIKLEVELKDIFREE